LIERYVAGPPPRVQPPPVLGTLTDRELEVLRQVASGRSNSEIAAALYIGEGIPGGLGVTGRQSVRRYDVRSIGLRMRPARN